MEQHGATFDQEDLEATKSFLLKNNARAFETLGDKLGILRDMSMFAFPADYVLQREAIVRNMSIERVKELAGRHLRPEAMIWLVVGDAATRKNRLQSLALGAAVMIDRDGRNGTASPK